MAHPGNEDRSVTRAAYFDMLAEMGVTKHIGSLKATEALIQGCHINARSRVLDVGCGIGLTPCYLARTYGCRVVGVDITPKMLARSQDEASRRGVAADLSWAVADAQALPFATGSFDAVLVESVSVFLDDPALGFREYARVTRPGGYVGVTESTWLDPSLPDMAALMGAIGGTPKTQDAWLALMQQSGLADIVGYVQDVDVREEARGRFRRMGGRGMLRILARSISAMLGNKNVRRVLKRATASAAPARVMQSMGYGIFIGRKAPPLR